MRFTNHSHLAGRHSFLSPSNYHWIRYSDEQLQARYSSAQAARRGTELHQFASEAIRLGIYLPEEPLTINMYVNDALNFGMAPEQPLYYSENCFGHADAVGFQDGLLRIHDLKTGVTPGSPHQLEVYAALFCLEYIQTPFEIEFELRIYQNNEVQYYSPYPETIMHIMDKIMRFDQMINEMRR